MPASAPLLPPAPRWIRLLCGGLFALYVTELVLRLASLPLDLLAWWPFGSGFGPWQLVTRYLLQGGHPGSVFQTLFGLAILWFVVAQLDRKLALQAMAAAAVGGTALALLLDAAGILGPTPNVGWMVLTTSSIVLFGLQRPDARMLAYFVLPITGQMFVWGLLVVDVLYFLTQQTLGTAEAIGSWLGVYAWYHWIGPGSHRRRLRAKGRALEKELSRFTVIEGGKEGKKPEDPWVH